MVLPTVGWFLLCHLVISTVPSDIPMGHPDLDSSLARLSSRVILDCMKLTEVYQVEDPLPFPHPNSVLTQQRLIRGESDKASALLSRHPSTVPPAGDHTPPQSSLWGSFIPDP